MPIPFPQSHWPAELLEAGPAADPAILLGGTATIGTVPHRVVAIRVHRTSLQVDVRADLDEQDAYAEFALEEMLEELEFFGEFGPSATVVLNDAHYVVWVVPA